MEDNTKLVQQRAKERVSSGKVRKVFAFHSILLVSELKCDHVMLLMFTTQDWTHEQARQ